MIEPYYHRVENAQKDHPDDDIKKGDSYYWKQLTGGAKKRYKDKPGDPQEKA